MSMLLPLVPKCLPRFACELRIAFTAREHDAERARPVSRIRAALASVAAVAVLGSSACTAAARVPKPEIFDLWTSLDWFQVREGAAVAEGGAAEAIEAFEETSVDKVEAALKKAGLVYFGERHDSHLDHGVQLEVISRIAGNAERVLGRPGSFVLGLEMVQQPYQAALTGLMEGDLDWQGFLEASQWEVRWGYDAALYEGVLRLARSRGADAVALNVPTELSHAVAKEGYAAVAEQEIVPELLQGAESYDAFIGRALAGHPGMSEAQVDRFKEAQTLWDSGMAQVVSDTLAARKARMLVLAGAVHVARGLGIPDRAHALLAAQGKRIPYIIIRPAVPVGHWRTGCGRGCLGEFVYLGAEPR